MATLDDRIFIKDDPTGERWHKLVEKKREQLDRKYQIVCFGRFAGNFHSLTVREAFADKNFKDTLFKTVNHQLNFLHSNIKKVDSIKGGVECFLDGMMDAPKIILEPSFRPPEKFADVFIEEGKINLPFPKIVMINGTVRIGDQTAIPHNHINQFNFSVIEQDGDGIVIHLVLSDGLPPAVPVVASVGLYVIKDPDRLDMLFIRPLVPASQVGWMFMDEVEMLTWQALKLIYMMTFHEGEVYMSAPTPREIQVNQKKMRKGKTPLVEFKLISILGKKRELPSVPHGSHAPPRQHWRRGHWRSYRSGRRSWVAPMLVGDEENGKVVKDYAIGNYPEDANIHSSKLSV